MSNTRALPGRLLSVTKSGDRDTFPHQACSGPPFGVAPDAARPGGDGRHCELARLKPHVHDIASAEHVIERSDHHPGDLPQPSDPLHSQRMSSCKGSPFRPSRQSSQPRPLAVVWTMARPAAVDSLRRYRSCAPTGLTVRRGIVAAGTSQLEGNNHEWRKTPAGALRDGRHDGRYGARPWERRRQEAPPFPTLLKQSEGGTRAAAIAADVAQAEDSPNKRARPNPSVSVQAENIAGSAPVSKQIRRGGDDASDQPAFRAGWQTFCPHRCW